MDHPGAFFLEALETLRKSGDLNFDCRCRLGQGAQIRAQALELLDGLCPLQLDQLMAIAGLDPADPEVRDQKADHVLITKAGDKRGALAVLAVTADITSGSDSLALKTISKSAQAHYQVFNNRSVLLGQTSEHDRPN